MLAPVCQVSSNYINYHIIYPVVMATTENYITKLYKLKLEGSSRLDWDITGIKKPLIVSGGLKSCYIMPEYGRCEDNNVGV